MVSNSHPFGSRKGTTQTLHQPTKSIELCLSLPSIYSPSASNTNLLDSQHIISTNRRVLLSNLTSRHLNKEKEFSCFSTKRNPRQVHLQQKSSETKCAMKGWKKKPEYFVTENDKDEEQEYVLEYMSAYKQLDNGLDELSTLAAKSEIDLNKVKEGTAAKLNTEWGCEEEVSENKNKCKNTLINVMKEILERRQRLSVYENKLSNTLKTQEASPLGRAGKKDRFTQVTDRKWKPKKSNTKNTVDKTLISSINNLSKPKGRELERESVATRPYVFKETRRKRGMLG